MTGIVRREGVAIRAVSQANYIVTRAYAEAGANEEIMSDPAIGLLLNMLHRNFEMTEASLVAFVTGSGAAAEVAARASVESSVNILYILTGSRASRLQAYFESYFSLTDQEVRRWQAETTDMGPSEAAVHLQGIKKRLAANEALRNMMRSVFGVTQEQWPKNIVERFKQLGAAMSYRTFYARMSSEVHGDAEETIRYFLGKSQDDPNVFEQMALENVWTTRLYIYYAVSWLVRASGAYAQSYSFDHTISQLQTELVNVETELEDISGHLRFRVDD